MEVLGGLRRRVTMSRGTAFAGAQIGFGGGGDVGTGGGLLAGVEFGASLPLSALWEVEATAGTVSAVDGAFDAQTGGLRLVRVFHRDEGESAPLPRLVLSVGLSQQRGSRGYMKSGEARATAMQETSVDLYVAPSTYVTVNAQTTVGGGVAGYAVGMIGMGQSLTLGEGWSAALEAHLGAAGGGGVDTSGGLIGGARAEIDYRLSSAAHLSLGVGKLQTLDGRGMAPAVAQLGLKFDLN